MQLEESESGGRCNGGGLETVKQAGRGACVDVQMAYRRFLQAALLVDEADRPDRGGWERCAAGCVVYRMQSCRR